LFLACFAPQHERVGLPTIARVTDRPDDKYPHKKRMSGAFFIFQAGAKERISAVCA
jgi:hypothetical protein